MDAAAPRPKIWLNGLLFALTALSAVFVGLGWGARSLFVDAGSAAARALADPRVLGLGALYAVTLLVILVGHELGHYLTCGRYGLPATLPYFIPAPTLIGTFGAFIRIKAPITRKARLFDIGANGPFVGFLLAVPAVAVGLAFSRVADFVPSADVIVFGEPLLFRLLSALMIGKAGATAALILHPVGFAGWVGLLVTSFNLIPLGQLDGGHVVYALAGKRAAGVSKAALAALFVMGVFFWAGWFVLAAAVGYMGHRSRQGLRHPPVLDEEVPLDRGRKLRAALIVLIFILSFVPDPVKGFDLLRLLQDSGGPFK